MERQTHKFYVKVIKGDWGRKIVYGLFFAWYRCDIVYNRVYLPVSTFRATFVWPGTMSIYFWLALCEIWTVFLNLRVFGFSQPRPKNARILLFSVLPCWKKEGLYLYIYFFKWPPETFFFRQPSVLFFTNSFCLSQPRPKKTQYNLMFSTLPCWKKEGVYFLFFIF